jgi:hypothetical protein
MYTIWRDPAEDILCSDTYELIKSLILLYVSQKRFFTKPSTLIETILSEKRQMEFRRNDNA